MKKTKLFKVGILSALLACGMIFCTSCKQPEQPEDPAKPEQPEEKPEEKPAEVTPKPFTISYNGKLYSAGTFKTADDWVSIEIKFAEVPPTDKVQFYLTSDAVQKEESWGTAYFSRYPQVAEVVTIDLDDWINNQKDDSGKTLAEQGATKITSVGIQAKATDSPDVKVASAIVTKKDGTKEAVVAVKDWGSTVTEN